MRTITLTYLTFSENAHNLHGFDEEELLDALDNATEGRSFTNQQGFEQLYALVELPARTGLGTETYGLGFGLYEDEAQIRTVLTPEMVRANELGGRGLPDIEPIRLS